MSKGACQVVVGCVVPGHSFTNSFCVSFNDFIPKGERGPVGPTGPFGEKGPRVSRRSVQEFCFLSDSLKSPEDLLLKYGSFQFNALHWIRQERPWKSLNRLNSDCYGIWPSISTFLIHWIQASYCLVQWCSCTVSGLRELHVCDSGLQSGPSWLAVWRADGFGCLRAWVI